MTTNNEMIARLVGFDTTSRDSNLALIHDVRDYLAGHGVDSVLIHSDNGEKANLFATIGPEMDGGVVLSGHTDVVPVDGQDWSRDPFQVVERDGRLYGRGTSDMKSFIAIALVMVPHFLKAGLKRPIHLAFSYDEEIGCLGVGGIIRHIDGLTTKPMAAIVGEPTDMTVVNAHKAAIAVNTVVTGLEAHSSLAHLGVNANMFAGEILHFLNGLAVELMEGPLNERFEPPYSSIQVGRIEGGTARNIVAREARLLWDIRALPGVDPDAIVTRVRAFGETELLPKMRQVHPAAAIDTRIVNQIPALVPEDGSAAETLVMALVGSNQAFAVPYGTEGGMFQESGIPTVICGPGNIEQAHKPDEFIEQSQVDACAEFMGKLAGHLANG